MLSLLGQSGRGDIRRVATYLYVRAGLIIGRMAKSLLGSPPSAATLAPRCEDFILGRPCVHLTTVKALGAAPLVLATRMLTVTKIQFPTELRARGQSDARAVK